MAAAASLQGGRFFDGLQVMRSYQGHYCCAWAFEAAVST
jgi:hypothetical protein